MKSVAVLQSYYISWKGYFYIIHDVETFIFYDDVQFTKNDWRNRNKCKTAQGTQWLSIPTGKDLDRLIGEVKLENKSWQEKHWKTILQNYSHAPFFNDYKDFFRNIYLEKEWEFLSELNHFLIEHISVDFLGIKVEFLDSRNFRLSGTRQERLISLLGQVDAGKYVSGPSAKTYIDETVFREKNIQVVWKEYAGYPEYKQFFPPFDHQVTILDLLFHTGPKAPWFIWGWREDGGPP